MSTRAGEGLCRFSTIVFVSACALAAVGCGAALACDPPPPCQEDQLVANIGHSTASAQGPWSTAGELTVSAGTTIYFRALDSANNPIGYSDRDCVRGEQKVDSVNYRWDWNYQPGDGDWGNSGGNSLEKIYNNPGDRIVRLFVDDFDGAGFTPDDSKADTVKVRVKLTLETDWMTGQSPWCTTADHAIYHDGLAGAWAAVGYTLGIDGDHDTNCEHVAYLNDTYPSQDSKWTYANPYVNQGCLLYIMGSHRWSENIEDPEPAGCTALGERCFVFMFAGYPPMRSNNSKTKTELHEPACHDATVGAIGHCRYPNPPPAAPGTPNCACFWRNTETGTSFCDDAAHSRDPNSDYCAARLRGNQDLEN